MMAGARHDANRHAACRYRGDDERRRSRLARYGVLWLSSGPDSPGNCVRRAKHLGAAVRLSKRPAVNAVGPSKSLVRLAPHLLDSFDQHRSHVLVPRRLALGLNVAVRVFDLLGRKAGSAPHDTARDAMVEPV